jgi:tetratricopeptide (TPR) repeat protein
MALAGILPTFELPPAVGRWLHSPRVQVAQGMAKLEAGGARAAARHFDRAAALRPADPRALFDAGTGRIAAGRRDAVEPLERAVAAAPASLRAPALYNLGNARLAAGDAPGAIEAYESCLRDTPTHAGAKHNLELALRELAKPKPPLRPPREAPGGKRQGERQPGRGDGPGDPSAEPRPGPPQQRGGGEPREERPGETPQAGAASPLPRFDEQPDMTAAQAAAILEAVENRERQARRMEAKSRSARRAVEKDW